MGATLSLDGWLCEFYRAPWSGISRDCVISITHGRAEIIGYPYRRFDEDTVGDMRVNDRPIS